MMNLVMLSDLWKSITDKMKVTGDNMYKVLIVEDDRTNRMFYGKLKVWG